MHANHHERFVSFLDLDDARLSAQSITLFSEHRRSRSLRDEAAVRRPRISRSRSAKRVRILPQLSEEEEASLASASESSGKTRKKHRPRPLGIIGSRAIGIAENVISISTSNLGLDDGATLEFPSPPPARAPSFSRPMSPALASSVYSPVTAPLASSIYPPSPPPRSPLSMSTGSSEGGLLSPSRSSASSPMSSPPSTPCSSDDEKPLPPLPKDEVDDMWESRINDIFALLTHADDANIVLQEDGSEPTLPISPVSDSHDFSPSYLIPSRPAPQPPSPGFGRPPPRTPIPIDVDAAASFIPEPCTPMTPPARILRSRFSTSTTSTSSHSTAESDSSRTSRGSRDGTRRRGIPVELFIR